MMVYDPITNPSQIKSFFIFHLRSPVELSSIPPMTYLKPITMSAITIRVPIKLVAARTISCTKRVGVELVFDSLILRVLLMFHEQVPFLICCGLQLTPKVP